MTKVTYGFSVQVGAGPQIAKNLATTVDAYDVLDFQLLAGKTDLKIEVQPSGASSIRLLTLNCSPYDPLVTYTVLDPGGDKGPFKLDAPQFFSGGAIAVFGVAPKTLQFANNNTAGDLTKTVRIEIFVGRDAAL